MTNLSQSQASLGGRKLSVVLVSLLICGCTAIPLSDIKPVISQLNQSCKLANDVRGDAASGATFRFLVPRGGAGNISADQAPQTAASFREYADKTQDLGASLPTDVRGTAVVNAIMRMMVQATAQAQVSAAKAANVPGSDAFDREIASYAVPGRLTHGDLETFTRKVVDTQLRPAIQFGSKAMADSKTNAFTTYFKAYYEGNFVDRFGTSYQKPQFASALNSLPVSLTVPDADIASALTVLVEYVVDLFDPTPVFGDGASSSSAKTFYPGNSTAEPTALSAKVARYQQIASGGCGITPEGAKLMADVAKAAGDRASAVGGLVSQSFGGFGFSLGVFGKVSIGDNQTLATVVKTGASRVAMRGAFATSYWALRNVKNPSSNPAADAADPARVFLSF